jgi:hypothetical protein
MSSQAFKENKPKMHVLLQFTLPGRSNFLGDSAITRVVQDAIGDLNTRSPRQVEIKAASYWFTQA